jgi:hypothetical protein
MPNEPTRIEGERPASAQEIALVRWLLDHRTSPARTDLADPGRLQVVSRCSCGCASVDFVPESPAPMDILSDYQWEDEHGNRFGIFIFAKLGQLAGLEVWSIDGRATPVALPDPDRLRPIEWNDRSEPRRGGR